MSKYFEIVIFTASIKEYAKLGNYKYNKEDNEILDSKGKAIPRLIEQGKDVSKLIPVKKLEQMLGSAENIKEQLQILQYFKDITPQVKSLNKLMNATQADVNGTGGSIAASMVMLDQLRVSLEDPNLVGVEGKVKGTAIETYTENAPKLFVDSMDTVLFAITGAGGDGVQCLCG